MWRAQSEWQREEQTELHRIEQEQAMYGAISLALEGGLEGGPHAAIALLRETIADAETAVSSKSPRPSALNQTLAIVWSARV
eukprot:COSAG04_NODE_1049_length_8559_cov_2.876359_6_plen_82_part_00